MQRVSTILTNKYSLFEYMSQRHKFRLSTIYHSFHYSIPCCAKGGEPYCLPRFPGMNTGSLHDTVFQVVYQLDDSSHQNCCGKGGLVICVLLSAKKVSILSLRTGQNVGWHSRPFVRVSLPSQYKP